MLRKLMAVLAAIGLYNALFFTTGFPADGSWGFLILIISIHSLLWLSFFPKYLSHKHSLAFSLSLLALSSTALAVFRASPTDTSLLSVLSLVLSAFSLYLLTLTHSRFGALTELLAIPFIQVKSWLDSAMNLVFHPPSPNLPKFPKPPKSTWSGIIRGLLITFPIAAIIIALLTHADPIFNKFAQDFLKSITPNITLFHRIIGSLVIAAISLPIAFMAIRREFRSPLNHPNYARHHLDLSIAVGAVSVILASFLVIQFRYIFASVPETDLHQFGVNTYSEYVRKGFIEMLLVSVIVYATIGLSFLVYRTAITLKPLNTLKTLNLVLLSEAAIFIISILRRVWLYQITHGLTRVRIYGTAFILMMLALTLILALRHLIKKHFPWYLAETSLVIITVFVTVLLNPDHLIATRFQPTVNHEIDYVYISRLSGSAVDGWLEAYSWAKNVVQNYTPDQSRHLTYANLILSRLRDHYSRLIYQYGTDSEMSELFPQLPQPPQIPQRSSLERSFAKNLSTHTAYLVLSAKLSKTELRDLLKQSGDLMSSAPPQPLDRSQESPLVD